MKTLPFITLTFLLILNSCNQNKDYDTTAALQGDWVDGFEQTFLFKDSLCNYLEPTGRFTNYVVRNDTIICTPKYPDNRRYQKMEFHIKRIEEDSLELEYYSRYSKKKERFLLSRIKNNPIHRLQLDSIIYLMPTDSLFVPCKFVKCINDSTYLIRNYGSSIYKKIDQKYEYYQISKKAFEFINDKLNDIDFNRVEKYSSEYSLSYSNPRPVALLYFKDESSNSKKTISLHNLYHTGCIVEEDDYPIELKIFLSYLDNILIFI